jgi:hypothetical protein
VVAIILDHAFLIVAPYAARTATRERSQSRGASCKARSYPEAYLTLKVPLVLGIAAVAPKAKTHKINQAP